MKVILADGLFASNPVPLIGLIHLAHELNHVIAYRQHALQGSPIEKIPGIPGLLRSHLARVAAFPPNAWEIEVTTDPESDWPCSALSIADAHRFLRSPLEVLLEDEVTDWAFICRLATPQQRGLLCAALQRGSLSIRHGGGLSGLQRIATRLTVASSSEAERKRLRVRRARTWVLFDRDTDPLDATKPSAASEKVLGTFGTYIPSDPWSFHVYRLCRRHIESYLPISVLKQEYPKRLTQIQILDSLRQTNPAAADFLNMKRGLKRSCSPHCTACQKGSPTVENIEQHQLIPPWTSLGLSERTALLDGFPKCSKLFDSAEPRFENDFIDEFNNREHTFTAETLIESILERL